VLEEDQDADSPLGLVWDAWAEKLDGKRTLQRIYVPNSEAEGMTLEDRAKLVRKRLEGQIKLLERWNKVNMFMKAAFGFSVDDDDSEVMDNGYEEKKVSPGSASSHERKWRILHATAAIKCHPSLFLLACALHPEQAFELDEKDLKAPAHVCGGCQSASHLTVLHFAASSRANGEYGRLVVNQLLSLNPDAAQAVDSDGCLPLHRIVENKDKTDWTVDGVKELYETNTRAVQAVDLDGRLPIHRAATAVVHDPNISDETMLTRSMICNLMEVHRDGACHADNFGCLPLHLIAQNGQVWDVQVQTLYDAFPAGARARTGVKRGNSLPLHLAAANPTAAFSLINRLVELHPRGASQSDRQGKLPLHLACETGLSWQSISSIHEAFLAAIRQPEQNARGWTALHMAAACPEADKELLLNLAELCPESASVADSKGRYPLHLACLSGKSWDDGLSALFEADPDALRCPDNVGLLPFHIASFRYSAVSSGEEIKRPSAIETNNRGFSHAGPLEAENANTRREVEDARNIEILFHLLKADPTVI
jgi:ankyrin repeat protein